MKTLYVSDLDGTLLRSNEITSEYTNRVINTLTDKGMIFSYATARSLTTAKKVTAGLTANIPLIVYNGAFVIDNISEKIMIGNCFDDAVDGLLDELFTHKVYPIKKHTKKTIPKSYVTMGFSGFWLLFIFLLLRIVLKKSSTKAVPARRLSFSVSTSQNLQYFFFFVEPLPIISPLRSALFKSR